MGIQEPVFNVIKIFIIGTSSFLLAFLFAPTFIKFLYAKKLWRKEIREKSVDGKEVPFFKKFHGEREVKTPRFGGILVWGTTLILIVFFYLLSEFTNIAIFDRLNFLSRNQTWLPLFTLISASILGLTDDFLQIIKKGKYIGGGLSLKTRLVIMGLIGLIGALWFYSKLGFNTIHMPGLMDLQIDGFYIPLFIFIMMLIYSGGVIDGIDGLAGGTFSIIFAAFAGIALFQNQIDIAAFCAAILGSLLAFLWFNIPPARLYLSETGTMGLCAVLTVVAFLTDSVLVLPIIAFLIIGEALSVFIQLISKRIFKRKVFLAAPIHHHFEAKGWPPYKVTMRFWIIGIILAVLGVAIRMFG
jgi:phospho-N-acetylmuramoyl-pentapeptide-transferase